MVSPKVGMIFSSSDRKLWVRITKITSSTIFYVYIKDLQRISALVRSSLIYEGRNNTHWWLGITSLGVVWQSGGEPCKEFSL